MKVQVKRRRFEDVVKIEDESKAVLYRTTIRNFERCFHQWERCWNRFIDLKEYNTDI
jgi:hypothetical protein